MMRNLVVVAIVLGGLLIGCDPNQDIQLAQPPVGKFSYEKDSLEVTFTDESTGKVVSLTWEFGDGGYALDTQVVTHTYDTAGTYTVKLTATNHEGDGVDEQEITVP